MPNIGGYDTYNFNDSDGISFLTLFLQRKHSIKALLKYDDKIPNLDGTIQVLHNTNSKCIPAQIFEVQVKTLDCEYSNPNKKHHKSQYKYSVDTKAFNIVKHNITLNPVLLFLVDLNNKKVFYIYASQEYVFNLELKDEKEKNIYFNDEDQITDIDAFTNTLKAIHEEKVALLNNGNRNIITTTNCLSESDNELLQKEWDFLDDVLTHKLKPVTSQLFPDTWKFGIAYCPQGSYDIVGIYQIKRGKRGEYIKFFNTEDKDCFSVIHYKKEKTNLHDVLIWQICNMLDLYYKKEHFSPSVLDTIILEEIAFYFLDTIASACPIFESSQYTQVYYKNTETVDELSRIWNSLLQMSIRRNQINIDKYYNTPNVFCEINPLSSIKNCNPKKKQKALQEFYTILSERISFIDMLPYPICFSKEWDYQLVHETIRELKKRNVKTITRPWKCKKYEEMFKEYKNLNISGLERFETGYLIEDIYYNSKKLLKHFPTVYNHFIDKIWGTNSKYHRINIDYSISFDEKNPLCEWTALLYNSHEFSIKFIKLSSAELESIQNNLKSYHVVCIKNSSFYSFAQLNTPLYQVLWNTFNAEMRASCDFPTHTLSPSLYHK